MPHNVVKKGTTQEHTDWITIGKHLSRISSECRKKWTSLQVKNLKKGRFTEEEDALIRHRVAEYEAVGIKRGLWADLGREMGRNANTIQERWETVLVADRYYVEQDDSSSRENVKQHKPLLEYKSRRFQWTPELVSTYQYKMYAAS